MDGSEALTRRRISVGKPIPETCAIFARGRARATVTKFIGQSTCPTVIFLTNTSRGHCFFCLESPHDRQRTHSFHLVSLQLSCMCTKSEMLHYAAHRPSLVDKPFCQRRRTGCLYNFALTKSPVKNDHMPERNAAVARPAPSASAICSAACFCKTS